MSRTLNYLVMYRASLWMTLAWPLYWNDIYQHLIRQTGDSMKDHLLILNYECEDITGIYEAMAILEKRGKMYVAHYPDFDNIVTICPNRRDLDYWIPAMLRTMLSEETGIMPFVRFKYSEMCEKNHSSSAV